MINYKYDCGLLMCDASALICLDGGQAGAWHCTAPDPNDCNINVHYRLYPKSE